MIEKLHRKLLRFRPYFLLMRPLYRYSLPGFGGVKIAAVLRFLFYGMQKSSLTNRAAAVSFKFFMALFPGIIVLISLIPFVPIENFQKNILQFFAETIPEQIYPLFKDTLNDIIKTRKNGVLGIGLLVTFFFSTNGMNGLMKAFNDSALITETRKPLKQRGIAILLTFFLVIFLFSAVASIILHKNALGWLYKAGYINAYWKTYLLQFKWLNVYLLFYLITSAIFYLAPARTMRWNFFSPGAFLTTLFSVFFTFLISLYINNFNSFNQVYGLLGSFPIILIWFFLNSLAVLIGFELNLAIKNAVMKGKE